jgi:hypothetical protein
VQMFSKLKKFIAPVLVNGIIGFVLFYLVALLGSFIGEDIGVDDFMAMAGQIDGFLSIVVLGGLISYFAKPLMRKSISYALKEAEILNANNRPFISSGNKHCCPECQSKSGVLISSECKTLGWKYENKDGSADRRRKHNYQEYKLYRQFDCVDCDNQYFVAYGVSDLMEDDSIILDTVSKK